MSAEVLRRAAALMRERAEAATPGRWEHVEAFNASFVCFDPENTDHLNTVAATKVLRADNRPGRRKDKRDADFIASWHPAVALAVADWLESVAQIAQTEAEQGWGHGIATTGALAVARAYLGESS